MKCINLFEKFIFDRTNQVPTINNFYDFLNLSGSDIPKDKIDNLIKDRLVDLEHKEYTIIISRKEDIKKIEIRIFKTKLRGERISIFNFNTSDITDDLISLISELKENGFELIGLSFRELNKKEINRMYKPSNLDKLKDKIVRNIKLSFKEI